MRAAWVVLVAAGCGGAAPDAPTDAATTGAARVSWAIRQGASQTGCEQVGGAVVHVSIGTGFLSPRVAEVACADWTAVIDGLAPGEAVMLLGLVDARGDVIATSNYEPATIVAGEIADVRPAIFATTDEPLDNMQRIFAGARIAWLNSSADPAARTFPSPGETTPTFGACCASPGKLCAPNPVLWQVDPWISVGFSIDYVAHSYSYAFLSGGTGSGATCLVRAIHDPDCDGVQTVYELAGSVDPSTGDVVAGEVTVTLDDNGWP